MGITGASGYIGRALVLRAQRAGWEVVALGRRDVPGLAHRRADLASAAFAATASFAMHNFTATGLRFEAAPHVDGYAIVCGFIIVAIAEVFPAGARLEEEQSLTV